MSEFELIIAEFKGEEAAEAALQEPAVRSLVDEGVIAVVNLAVLKMDKDGKLSFRETQDVGSGRGALAGAITGGLIGLLGGPAGALLGAVTGAVTGGIAANAIDMGFLNDDLKEYGKDMEPDSSALVALVEHIWIERMRDELALLGAEVVAYALSGAAQQKLSEIAAGEAGQAGEDEEA